MNHLLIQSLKKNLILTHIRILKNFKWINFCIAIHVNNNGLNYFARYWFINNFNCKFIEHLKITGIEQHIMEHNKKFLKKYLNKMDKLKSVHISKGANIYGYIIGQIKPNLKLSKLYIDNFYNNITHSDKHFPKCNIIYIDFIPSKSRFFQNFEAVRVFVSQKIISGCIFLYVGYKDNHLVREACKFIKCLTEYISNSKQPMITIKNIYLHYPIDAYCKSKMISIKNLFNLVDACKKKNISACIDINAAKLTIKKSSKKINIHFK